MKKHQLPEIVLSTSTNISSSKAAAPILKLVFMPAAGLIALVVLITALSPAAAPIEDAPKVPQDRLQDRFQNLKEWEKSFRIAALDRISDLLDAEDLDASPILDVGLVDRPPD